MGADRAGDGRHPRVRAASTSRDFANSLSFFANVGSMEFTKRQRLSSRVARPILAAIAVGLLLGFAGPFGSYPAYPTATRYAFWLGLTAIGVVAAIAADAVVPRSRVRPGAVRIGVLALLSALPMTFVVAWTLSLLEPGRVFAPAQLPLLYVCVAVVQVLVVFATTIASAAPDDAAPLGRSPVAPDAPAPARFPAPLLSKLPREIGTDIRALETEDHYLRVHAAGGSALVLMRMADAVALIDPALGAQVHRRWWVAAAAVTAMRTTGQRLSLTLIDNREVPVGRTFAAAVRARFAGARVPPPPPSPPRGMG